jgi:hypothetical protein
LIDPGVLLKTAKEPDLSDPARAITTRNSGTGQAKIRFSLAAAMQTFTDTYSVSRKFVDRNGLDTTIHFAFDKRLHRTLMDSRGDYDAGVSSLSCANIVSPSGRRTENPRFGVGKRISLRVLCLLRVLGG